MKLRISVLAVTFMLALSLGADAQATRATARGKAPAVTYGSVERTKLLSQSAAKRGDARAVYGSVERRALLTRTTVRYPQPLSHVNGSKRTSHRRR